MKLWIDTEFNEFQGDFISIALIDELGREFYESVGCKNPSPWVAANVMPIIGINNITLKQLQIKLQDWLSVYENIDVIADWPEDIKHFCALLIVGPGIRINTPMLNMQVKRELAGVSQLPHNALADAKANRIFDLGL